MEYTMKNRKNRHYNVLKCGFLSSEKITQYGMKV